MAVPPSSRRMNRRMNPRVNRRDWLVAAGACIAAPVAGATAPPTGWVAPRPAAPDIELTNAQGQRMRLREMLQGRVVAAHLMFTGCSATCPAQGLLFSQVAERLGTDRRFACLSISIDALGDDPGRLLRWQQRHGAQPQWQASVPAVADVDRLARYLRGGEPRPGTHSDQVFVFDAHARLAYRTGDHPNPVFLLQLMQHLA